MSKKVISNISKLIEEYNTGTAASQLAKQYNTSTSVITNTLKCAGITLRSLSSNAKQRIKEHGHPWIGRKHSKKSKLKMVKNHADVSGCNNPRFKKKGKYAEDGVWLNYDNRGYLRRTVKNHPLAFKDGIIGEHVYQASLKWGADAVRGNDVHHINRIKDDNRIENLIILSREEHKKIEDNFNSNLRWIGVGLTTYGNINLIIEMIQNKEYQEKIIKLLIDNGVITEYIKSK